MKTITKTMNHLYVKCSIAGGGRDCLSCTFYFTVEGMKLELRFIKYSKRELSFASIQTLNFPGVYRILCAISTICLK